MYTVTCRIMHPADRGHEMILDHLLTIFLLKFDVFVSIHFENNQKFAKIMSP